ncbi:hypothetical protein SGLAM104S_08559 [Streptomyces glaucescens]
MPKGLWVQNDGYEYPLVLVVVAATLALTGRWSADHALGVTPWPVRVCAAARVLGPVQRTAQPAWSSVRSRIWTRYGRGRLPFTYASTRPGVTVMASTRPCSA